MCAGGRTTHEQKSPKGDHAKRPGRKSAPSRHASPGFGGMLAHPVSKPMNDRSAQEDTAPRVRSRIKYVPVLTPYNIRVSTMRSMLCSRSTRPFSFPAAWHRDLQIGSVSHTPLHSGVLGTQQVDEHPCEQAVRQEGCTSAGGNKPLRASRASAWREA